MRAKTEELLYLLLWSADQLARPTFRNLTESFESWAYRNGFLRELAELERRRFLERNAAEMRATRLYRLTTEGRLRALGGRDPEAQWSRPWDGRWRLVLFDVPLAANSHRVRLWRYLSNRGFGYLQDSVWISPHPLTEEVRLLASAKIDVESLILLEAKPCAGESNADIVGGAWDFDRINSFYSRHLGVLSEKPTVKRNSETNAKALRRWAEAERIAWKDAVSADPLLPKELLPAAYLGRRAWQRRIKVLEKARRDLVAFKPQF